MIRAKGRESGAYSTCHFDQGPDGPRREIPCVARDDSASMGFLYFAARTCRETYALDAAQVDMTCWK